MTRWLCLLGMTLVAGICSAIDFGATMFTGDSITAGFGTAGYGGYRGPLISTLRFQGHTLSSVGPNTYYGDLMAPGDRSHAGNNGWKIEDISFWLPTWMNNYQPRTILLMAGTNNWGEYNDALLTANRINEMVEVVWATDPTVRVYLANIIDASPTWSGEPQMRIQANNVDAAVRAKVLLDQGVGRDIHFVDMRSSIDASTDLMDAVHPSDVGYAKMAQRWSSVMTAVPEPGMVGFAVVLVPLLRRRRR